MLTYEALVSMRSIYRGETLFEYRVGLYDEVIVILSILYNGVLADSSFKDIGIVQSTGCINAGFAGHREVWHEYEEMSICHQRPLYHNLKRKAQELEYELVAIQKEATVV